ncbi:MAG: dephospho-CoA kinase [Arenicellales bacterium]|nr:dephospho-CoA kinase [Arenicellales bacterium]MDP6948093.1 dephospho-CoA kinase [Arenicellales bacterium]
MLRIALTGGIGSGKSAVSDRLITLGVPVFDADDFSHQVTRPGQPAIAAIADAFGAQVLTADGSLDREALRQIIFADTKARHRLEAILHPEIRRRMQAAALTVNAPYCVFSIPLLLETGQAADFDRVLVVEAPTATRRERAQRRSGLSKAAFDAICKTQATAEQCRQAADDLLINDDSLEALHAQVDTLHRRYLELAGVKGC